MNPLLLASGAGAGVCVAAGTLAVLRAAAALGADVQQSAVGAGDRRLAAGGGAVVLAGLGEALARKGLRSRVEELDHLCGQAGVIGERSGREVLGQQAALAAACAPLLGGLFALAAGPLGALLGAALGALAFAAPSSSLRTRADDRMRRLRADLPFALDLMALVVRAGGDMNEAVEAVRANDPTAPLSDELGQVQQDVATGAPFSRALRRMAARLGDPDVDTLVDTFVQGEELGLSLANVLRGLADTVRARRYESAEEAAGESTVRMLGPSMIVMMAVLILFLFPIVMSLLRSGPF